MVDAGLSTSLNSICNSTSSLLFGDFVTANSQLPETADAGRRPLEFICNHIIAVICDFVTANSQLLETVDAGRRPLEFHLQLYIIVVIWLILLQLTPNSLRRLTLVDNLLNSICNSKSSLLIGDFVTANSPNS
ncbi:hypothetical protein AVEN_80294-1 [Araneus ventricosus]|uniref:Uncharacterized protein n=1 Tax=Araneus ventricosus TaxID=182803 RepID=A0A4Y2IJD9_ARAVE|nr:hypothetical protein AVEN_80294-1 [Araneus ventricosus]